MNAETLTPERWREVKRVFELAIELQGDERERILAVSCADDAEMRREVERMIIADEAAQTFMEHPAVSLSELAHAMEETDAVNIIGRRIGVYKVTSEIGRGGMGAVYLAERDDDEYRKRVAVKLIKRGMDTDYVLRCFRLERQILAGLEHPNIARLLDGGVTEQGLPFFAMEYVEGVSILDYADANQLTDCERR